MFAPLAAGQSWLAPFDSIRRAVSRFWSILVFDQYAKRLMSSLLMFSALIFLLNLVSTDQCTKYFVPQAQYIDTTMQLSSASSSSDLIHTTGSTRMVRITTFAVMPVYCSRVDIQPKQLSQSVDQLFNYTLTTDSKTGQITIEYPAQPPEEFSTYDFDVSLVVRCTRYIESFERRICAESLPMTTPPPQDWFSTEDFPDSFYSSATPQYQQINVANAIFTGLLICLVFWLLNNRRV